jgi:parvulin-like peptidyl-prolyl isomerase
VLVEKWRLDSSAMIVRRLTMTDLRVLVSLLLGVAGLGLACQSRDPVILALEGESVRRSDFDRYLAEVQARTGAPDGPADEAVRRGLLDAFLEERALVIEARRRGLLPKGAPRSDEPAAVTKLIATAVATPEVTDAEVAEWHRTHPDELGVPERVALRQVLVGTLNEARDVRRRLAKAKDARMFDQIARTQSKGPEAPVGGFMGTFERGQLPPELEAAAFALPQGGTSEPVETPLGYHVLRVESRQPAREIPFEEARERIREQLVREKRTAAERAFAADLMARARVNHEAALVVRTRS